MAATAVETVAATAVETAADAAATVVATAVVAATTRVRADDDRVQVEVVAVRVPATVVHAAEH
ncbi:hypothetical protein, partial [Streptomyces sp. NPDC088184]|uniref:hypothetical protein n=1 Tax=Streptomyces sp. NPDC088184 TaxID=3160991 RepID=UPI003433F7A8